MAKVSMNMPLTNTMGDFSVHQMEGVDKLIIMTSKGTIFSSTLPII